MMSHEQSRIEELKIKADEGDTISQRRLGLYYYDQENPLAAHYFKLAATNGDACAQHNLGCCYQTGTGGAVKDEVAAVQYFNQAALKGDVPALYHLGRCHLEGIGTPENIEKALQFFHLAADSGDAYSLYQLGRCYQEGKGVEENKIMALKYFFHAAKHGLAEAHFELGMAYTAGEDLYKNKLRAMVHYYLASEQKNALACYELARHYESNDIDEEQLLVEIENYYGEGKRDEIIFPLPEKKSSSNAALVKKYDRLAKEYGYDISRNTPQLNHDKLIKVPVSSAPQLPVGSAGQFIDFFVAFQDQHKKAVSAEEQAKKILAEIKKLAAEHGQKQIGLICSTDHSQKVKLNFNKSSSSIIEEFKDFFGPQKVGHQVAVIMEIFRLLSTPEYQNLTEVFQALPISTCAKPGGKGKAKDSWLEEELENIKTFLQQGNIVLGWQNQLTIENPNAPYAISGGVSQQLSPSQVTNIQNCLKGFKTDYPVQKKAPPRLPQRRPNANLGTTYTPQNQTTSNNALKEQGFFGSPSQSMPLRETALESLGKLIGSQYKCQGVTATIENRKLVIAFSSKADRDLFSSPIQCGYLINPSEYALSGKKIYINGSAITYLKEIIKNDDILDNLLAENSASLLNTNPVKK